MEIYGKKIILALVYCPPKQEISTFIDGMTSIFRDTWKGVWIMLLSNYNLDQVLQGNINRLVCLKEIFRLQQCSWHSTRQLGGILDIVFNSKVNKSVSLAPFPISATLSFVFNFRSLKRIGLTGNKKLELG